MRHHKKGRKFGREKNIRKALLKSLAVALIMKGKIKTTLARAKELRAVAERLVTHAKKHPTIVKNFLPKSTAVKLIKEIAPKYASRNGGYTRVIKLPARRSDAAKIAIIEFV